MGVWWIPLCAENQLGRCVGSDVDVSNKQLVLT